MAEETAAQNLSQTPVSGTEIVPLDSASVKADILMDLDDVARLTFRPELNPIIKTAINRIGQTFQMRVAYLLSPVRPGQGKPLREESLNPEDLEDISETDLDNLETISGFQFLVHARAEIRGMIMEILGDSRYQRAARSYRDQQYSPQAREALYHFLSHHGFTEYRHLNSDQPLYHGVALGEFGDELCDHADQPAEHLLSPEAYAAKIRAITMSGLKASPAPENLPLLESVFCVDDIRHAYGVAVLGFPVPENEKLWSRSGCPATEGIQLVKPRQTGPFNILLRSPAFYEALDGLATQDIFGQLNVNQYGQFLGQLKTHLTSAGLPFSMVNPDGSTSKAV